MFRGNSATAHLISDCFFKHGTENRKNTLFTQSIDCGHTLQLLGDSMFICSMTFCFSFDVLTKSEYRRRRASIRISKEAVLKTVL